MTMRETVSIEDAAGMLASTPEEVRRLIRQGQLPVDSEGCLRRDAVVQYMNEEGNLASPEYDRSGIGYPPEP